MLPKDPPGNPGGPDPGREPWIGIASLGSVLGDADQASPLDCGRSWPPVRQPVQLHTRPGNADRGVCPGLGRHRPEHAICRVRAGRPGSRLGAAEPQPRVESAGPDILSLHYPPSTPYRRRPSARTSVLRLRFVLIAVRGIRGSRRRSWLLPPIDPRGYVSITPRPLSPHSVSHLARGNTTGPGTVHRVEPQTPDEPPPPPPATTVTPAPTPYTAHDWEQALARRRADQNRLRGVDRTLDETGRRAAELNRRILALLADQ